MLCHVTFVLSRDQMTENNQRIRAFTTLHQIKQAHQRERIPQHVHDARPSPATTCRAHHPAPDRPWVKRRLQWQHVRVERGGRPPP